MEHHTIRKYRNILNQKKINNITSNISPYDAKIVIDINFSNNLYYNLCSIIVEESNSDIIYMEYKKNLNLWSELYLTDDFNYIQLRIIWIKDELGEWEEKKRKYEVKEKGLLGIIIRFVKRILYKILKFLSKY